MSLSPTSRRADAFARLLDSGTRTDDPVSAPLLAVAGALGAVPPIAGPRPEFRTALRQRVMAVAAVQGVGETTTAAVSTRLREARSSWRVQRRVMAITGSVAVVTAVSGVGVGASKSLPGDPFYKVKRATEDVQLAMTQGVEAKGKRHLEFARTRLNEVQALVGRPVSLGPLGGSNGVFAAGGLVDGSSLIASTLHDMDSQTVAGAKDLIEAYRLSGTSEPLRVLGHFAHTQSTQLAALAAALPQTARNHLAASLSLLTAVSNDVALLTRTNGRIATTTAPGGSPTAPSTPGGPSSGGPGAPQPTTTNASTPGASPTAGHGTTKHPLPTPTLPTIPTLPVPTVTPSVNPSIPDLGDLLGGSGH